MKQILRDTIEKVPFLKSWVLDPLRNARLQRYYTSLLPLNEYDESTKMMWLGRIEKVKQSADNQKIQKIADAGRFKGPHLLMHNGLIIDPLSYYGAPVMRMLMENQAVHEPQEEYVFQEVLKQMPVGATMMELGCYWGFYSMWFASKIKNARNILIDNSDGVARGKANFALNKLNGTFLTGYIGKDNPSAEIQLTNVDRICREQKVEFIDLLHSDIQGFELEMLQTMPNMIQRRAIGYIFISTHSQELHYNCIAFLEENGYKIVCHADLEGSFSEDGLIVAKDPKYPGPDSFEISIYKAPAKKG